MSRTRWRSFLRKGVLLLLGLAALSAVSEHVLELRDASRLTANDTFYTTGERRVRYRLMGPRAPKPTIVLLSGLMGSLEQWDRVQTALSTSSPVVSYDRGGTGFSDPADAHDANADADELGRLLHSREIGGPFVLVSYSSSSMMAIVFAAKHPDLAKGIVFVDPTLRSPAPGAKTYRRIYWRPAVMGPLEAFFGYTRLKLVVAGRNLPPSSPASERWNAVIESTHHWLASAHDAMSLDASADEADAARANSPFSNLPLGVLTTADPSSSEARDLFARQKRLAASSGRGIMRELHGNHSELLNDPVAVDSIVDMIRTITDEVRAKAAAGSGSGLPMTTEATSPEACCSGSSGMSQ